MNLPIRIEHGRANGTQTVHDPFATAKHNSAFLDPRQFRHNSRGPVIVDASAAIKALGDI